MQVHHYARQSPLATLEEVLQNAGLPRVERLRGMVYVRMDLSVIPTLSSVATTTTDSNSLDSDSTSTSQKLSVFSHEIIPLELYQQFESLFRRRGLTKLPVGCQLSRILGTSSCTLDDIVADTIDGRDDPYGVLDAETAIGTYELPCLDLIKSTIAAVTPK